MSGFLRKYRLLNKNDFQSVFANPHKIAYKFITALHQKNTLGYARIGFVLSKRYLPKAVDRNTFRRIARESFRQYHDELKELDIILLIRSECTPLDRKALRTYLDHIWQKLLTSS